jgi:hypothetical protein
MVKTNRIKRLDGNEAALNEIAYLPFSRWIYLVILRTRLDRRVHQMGSVLRDLGSTRHGLRAAQRRSGLDPWRVAGPQLHCCPHHGRNLAWHMVQSEASHPLAEHFHHTLRIGSGCNTIPRRPRSYAALRLLRFLRRKAPVSPCLSPTSARTLVLCPSAGSSCVRRRVCASEILVRLPVLPVPSKEKRGPPRFLGRPLPACQGSTPRRLQPPLAYFYCGKTAVAFRSFSALGIRNGHRLGGRCPSARTLARLRIAGRVAAPAFCAPCIPVGSRWSGSPAAV